MSPAPTHNPDLPSRFDEAVAAYLEAAEAGPAPTREEWLRRYPEVASELAAFLDDQEVVGPVIAPLCDIAKAGAGAETGHTVWPNLHPAPELANIPAQTFGDYEILEEVGSGGMGVVYKARQKSLNRLVALKMIGAGALAGPAERQRFQQEAETAAALDHPHIVPIYEIGKLEGRPYFTMKLLRPGTLTNHATPLSRIRENSDRNAARQLVAVARAVHHAHQRGVLHRDLKPGNILADENGQAVITDFGLAKRLAASEEPNALTLPSGQPVGTPAYMAPEQATGNKQAITVAADVYGLGAVLYTFLTGRPPFQASDIPTLFDQIRSAPPAPPRSADPTIARDLETICLKCLEKEPGRRYASAADLADDLDRWLRGEPIAARPISGLGRLWRWCRRQPALAFTILLSTCLCVTVTAWLISDELRKAKQQTADATERARQDRKRALLQQIQQIRLTPHSNGWSERAVNVVREGIALGPDEHWRDQAAATLVGLDAFKERTFNEECSAVAIDSTGKRVLMAGVRHLVNGTWEVTPARLWDESTGKEIVSAKAGEGVVLFDEQGSALQLVGEPGPALLLWSVEKQQQVAEFKLPSTTDGDKTPDWKFTALAVSPKGDYVAAIVRDERRNNGLLLVWETGPPRLLLRQETMATALAFGHKGPWLAVAEAEEITIWAIPAREKVKSLKTGPRPITCMAFGRHPSGMGELGPRSELLATAQAGGTVTIWDMARGLPISFCRGSYYEIHALAFAPDGATLGSAGRRDAKLWDTATGQHLLDLGHRDTMSGLAFTPDGRRLAISSIRVFGPPGVDIWRLEWGRGLRSLRGLTGQVAQVRFSPDGKRLAALAHNWEVAIWDTARESLDHLLTVSRGLFADNAALAFSPGGKKFAFAAGRNAVLWDLATGKEVKRWPLPPGYVDHLGFHGPDKLLLFRMETKDAATYPDSAAPARQRPRVCRIRDLLGPKPLVPLREITAFSRGVFQAGAPTDAAFFVVQGMGDKGRFTTAYDGPTGTELWSKPCDPNFDGGASSLWFDPTGKVMTLLTEPRPKNVSLVDMPSGSKLDIDPLPTIIGVHCLGPRAKTWGAVAHLPPYGFHLFRRGDKTPLVILGLDTPSHLLRAEFNAAGTHCAWGNDDGSVTLCEIEEVRRRLRKLGLGW